MFTLRPLYWPEDREPLRGLDTSFSTNRIYRLHQTGKSFTLEEVPLESPLQKVYPFAEQLEQLPYADWVWIATNGEQLAGVIVLRFDDWNHRAVIEQLYVSPTSRHNRIGRALIDAALEESRRRSARCLWVETQTINYSAVQFYERCGFTCCGFDTSLYDPAGFSSQEVALFFSRNT